MRAPDNPADPQPGDEWYGADDSREADAVNDTIAALAEGEYAGEIDRFWEDLEAADPDDDLVTDYLDSLEPEIEVPCPPPLDEPFDPPAPSITGRTERRCERVLDDIAANKGEYACGPPAVGCPPCDVDSIIDTQHDPTLVFEADTDLFQPSEITHVTEADKDLFRAGWNLLKANGDLVFWIVCVLEGESNAWCVVERLNGWRGFQTVVFDSYPAGSHADAIMMATGTHTITVMKAKGVWIDWLGDVGDVEAFPEQALCAIFFVAATILHELIHGCVHGDSGDKPRECRSTYMAHNSLLWALAARYPCMTDGSGICAGLLDPCWWMSDGSATYPTALSCPE